MAILFCVEPSFSPFRLRVLAQLGIWVLGKV